MSIEHGRDNPKWALEIAQNNFKDTIDKSPFAVAKAMDPFRAEAILSDSESFQVALPGVPKPEKTNAQEKKPKDPSKQTNGRNDSINQEIDTWTVNQGEWSNIHIWEIWTRVN